MKAVGSRWRLLSRINRTRLFVPSSKVLVKPMGAEALITGAGLAQDPTVREFLLQKRG